MPRRLTTEELQALGRLSTPTLSNAIETFDVRPHNEGFAGPESTAVRYSPSSARWWDTRARCGSPPTGRRRPDR